MPETDYTLIPFAPDWSFPVQHTLRHQSAAAEGLTGIEERAAFFRTPRRRVQYTVTAAAVTASAC